MIEEKRSSQRRWRSSKKQARAARFVRLAQASGGEREKLQDTFLNALQSATSASEASGVTAFVLAASAAATLFYYYEPICDAQRGAQEQAWGAFLALVGSGAAALYSLVQRVGGHLAFLSAKRLGASPHLLSVHAETATMNAAVYATVLMGHAAAVLGSLYLLGAVRWDAMAWLTGATSLSYLLLCSLSWRTDQRWRRAYGVYRQLRSGPRWLRRLQAWWIEPLEWARAKPRRTRELVLAKVATRDGTRTQPPKVTAEPT